MSQRNFILLIIILVVATAAVLGFLYFSKPEGAPRGEDGEGINFFAEFNPFGGGGTTPREPETPVDISGFEPDAGRQDLELTKVSSMPIAGFGLYLKERFKEESLVTPITAPSGTPPKAVAPLPPATEFVTAVRYVDKVTGNIFQTFADYLDERKFSSTVIPKVYDAYFSGNGEGVIMRYLKPDEKTIETFAGTLPKEPLGIDLSGTNELKGSFLPENISDISVSPDGSKAFYLFEQSGTAIGTTYEFSSGKKAQVFDSAFTEWLSSWPNEKMITLTTKPSSGIVGHAYKTDPAKKDFSRVFGDVGGLTTLASPDGTLILFSNDLMALSLYHTDTRTTDALGINTMPEKCVWGKESISRVVYCAVPKNLERAFYPDAWYQGEVSFSDEIWKIDIESGVKTLVLDPVLAPEGEEIDGIKLALDQNEAYLFLVNKKDSFLWRVKLK